MRSSQDDFSIESWQSFYDINHPGFFKLVSASHQLQYGLTVFNVGETLSLSSFAKR